MRFYRLMIAALAAALLMAACSSDDSESLSSSKAGADDTEADGTGDGSEDEGDSTGGGVGDLQAVRESVVQITTRGSFRDPELGTLSGAGAGSGFIIDAGGLTVTNNHVVTGAGVIEVILADGTTRNAKVLGVSECSDLAVIDIDGDGYPALDWYRDEIQAGLEVYTAGFPLGDPEFTLTKGIVSKASANGDWPWASVTATIEHDASIQQGNSGGALVTADGRVVGVNYAGYTPAGGTTEQFFAISVETAEDIVGRLADGEDVNSLGINGTAVYDEDAGIAGVWVAGVDSGSPADSTGIEPGDILLDIEGVPLGEDGTMSAYCDVLRSHVPGDVLSVRVLRYDSEQVLAGQFNGDELEESFSFAAEIADETGAVAGTPYSDYRSVTDDTGTITIDVPVEWVDLDTAPADPEDGTAPLPAIVASTDNEAFFSSWTTPGLLFLASTDVEPGADLGSLLDARSEAVSDFCQNGGRFDYDDSVFSGEYDIWEDCDGTGVSYVIVAALNEAGDMTLVEVQVVTDADLDALDRALQTFNIVG